MKKLQKLQGLDNHKVPKLKPEITDVSPAKMAAVVTKKSEDLNGSLESSLRHPPNSKPSQRTTERRLKQIPAESGNGLAEICSNSISIQEFPEDMDHTDSV